MKSLFQKLLQEAKQGPEYYREDLLLRFSEQVAERMKFLGITRKELADRLNLSKARVSQILNGRPNLTVDTIAQISFVLDWKPVLAFESLALSEENAEGTEAEPFAELVSQEYPIDWAQEHERLHIESQRAFHQQLRMEQTIEYPDEAKEEAKARCPKLALAA